MKEEIVQGLRNAIERGYSLESAAQSFVNAGYNPREVQEAMAILSSPTVSQQSQPIQQQFPQQNMPSTYTSPKKQLISPPSNNQQVQQRVQPSQLEVPPIQTESQRKRKKILIILGVILFIILGGIITLSLLADSILKSIT
jgi:hypothetical protein